MATARWPWPLETRPRKAFPDGQLPGGRPAALRQCVEQPDSPLLIHVPTRALSSSLPQTPIPCRVMFLKHKSNHYFTPPTPSPHIVHRTELKQPEDRIWGQRLWLQGITLSLHTRPAWLPIHVAWKPFPSICSPGH